MILNAYSIYDRKTCMYHVPFFSPTHGAATRLVADLAADTNTSVGRHPGDYVVFHVGYYDDAKAELLAVSPLHHVVDVQSLLNPPAGADLFTKGK